MNEVVVLGISQTVFGKFPDKTAHELDQEAVGAAPVPESLKQRIIEKVGTDVLWECYGCSEAGMLTYNSPQEQVEKPLSSGKPYEEVELKIVDDAWNTLPPGQTGEIAARTPFVLKTELRKPYWEGRSRNV